MLLHGSVIVANVCNVLAYLKNSGLFQCKSVYSSTQRFWVYCEPC